MNRSEHNFAEVPMVTTGGTPASDPMGKDKSLKPKRKDFRALVGPGLRRKKIVIPEIYSPYCILSENTTFEHLIKLVHTLIDIIETRKPRTIVVVHGTDMMDHVVQLLDDDASRGHLEEFFPKLGEPLERLHELIEEFPVSIVFTGSNTTKKSEIRRNISGACELEHNIDLGEGIYIFFDGTFVRGKYATKDIFDGNSMRYVDDESDDFRKRRNVKKAEEHKMMQKLDKFFRVRKPITKPEEPRVHTGKLSLAEENAIIRKLQRFHRAIPSSYAPVHLYNAAEFHYDNHDALREDTVRDGIRAIILILFHGGTANTDTKHSPELSVEKLVRDIRKEARKQARDVVFFAVTENYEPVTLDAYDTSVRLRGAGVVPLYDMTQGVALHKLGLVVQACKTPAEIIDIMLKNTVGEINERLIKRRHITSLKKAYDSTEGPSKWKKRG